MTRPQTESLDVPGFLPRAASDLRLRLAKGGWNTILPDPLGWVFWLSVLALLARAMLLSGPIIMDDEYYYAKTAQLWYLNAEHTRSVTAMIGGEAPTFPNAFFFAIYQFCYLFGPSFYTAAKLLNVAFVTISAIAVARVGRLFTGRSTAGWIGVLTLWLPATAYGVAFMAEPLYECVVWCGLLAFFSLLPRHERGAAAALGLSLGIAYLTKPTAVVLLMTANAVVAIVAWRSSEGKRRLRSVLAVVAVLNLAFFATGYLLNTVLTGSVAWDPIGGYYRQDLSKAMAVEATHNFLADAVRYVAAYTFFVLLLFGPAVTMLIAGFRKAAQDTRTGALAAFAAVGLALLVLGTAKASINWEYVHEGNPQSYSTRYMSVLFPLLLIAYATLYEGAATAITVRKWIGAIAALAVACFAVLFVSIENTIQVKEVFWTRGWVGIAGPDGIWAYAGASIVFLSVTVYHAFARRPRATVYAGVLAVWAILSAMGLFRLELWDSTGWLGPSDRAGLVVSSLVAPSARDNGLVVFDYRWRASTFMFRYPGFVPIRREVSGSIIDRDSIPSSAKWVVFLGPVRPGFDSSACIRIPDALWCPLASDALVASGT